MCGNSAKHRWLESVKNHRVKRIPQYHRQRRPQYVQTSGKEVAVDTETQEYPVRMEGGEAAGVGSF